MKTIISSTGNKLSSPFDLRFGRAGWFCLFDEETGETSFFQNEFKEASQGAGGKVVEKVVELGVGKVISGDFGPKAKDLLDRFHIQMVIIPDGTQKIEEIIAQLK
ncbi:MAG: NifB/NifX family molybdenum-iron cluster-binding protein [Bacteroidota bacterium]